MKLEIYTTLVVTTAHLSPSDQQRLDSWVDGNGPVTEDFEYGWRVYVSTFMELLESSHGFCRSLSSSFISVMKRAHEFGCRWVEFDSDGDVYEGIPLPDENE